MAEHEQNLMNLNNHLQITRLRQQKRWVFLFIIRFMKIHCFLECYKTFFVFLMLQVGGKVGSTQSKTRGDEKVSRGRIGQERSRETRNFSKRTGRLVRDTSPHGLCFCILCFVSNLE